MTGPSGAPAWWGGAGRGQDRLTLLDLVGNETLSLELAALLWLLVEARTSLLAAASPQLAGKTTLVSALLDLAPPGFRWVLTRGELEDFAFIETTDASETYILVPELSDHTPAYLWGDSVRTLFEALNAGYSMAATMHADSPDQVLEMLAAPPASVPKHLLHQTGLIVNISMGYGDWDIIRRVSMVTLLEPGPTTVTLAHSSEVGGPARVLDSRPATDAVRGRTGVADIDAELAHRRQTILGWIEDGPMRADAFRERVVDHYRRRDNERGRQPKR